MRDVVAMGEKWNEFKDKIVNLQGDLSPFRVDFLDRDDFKRFADELFHKTKDFHEIRITGYFSETVRATLEKLVRLRTTFAVKLLCPVFPIKSGRDSRNLQALEKLSKAGAEIKFNNRLHARFLVASFRTRDEGLLLIGSFDFNTECMGRERYDAGIMTRHPDLVKSATELFEQIWNEPESITLEDFIKKRKL